MYVYNINVCIYIYIYSIKCQIRYKNSIRQITIQLICKVIVYCQNLNVNMKCRAYLSGTVDDTIEPRNP